MTNDKRNLLSRLDELISNLSKKEKQGFKGYIKKTGTGKGKGESNYVILYNYFCSSNSGVQAKINQKTGLNNSELLSAARHLRKTVFESLAYSESNLISGLLIARKAREKGFLRYASGILMSEISQANAKENIEYLELLLSEIYSLNKHFSMNLVPETKVPDFRIFMAHFSGYTQMKHLILELQNLIKDKPENRKGSYSKYAEQVHHLKTNSPFIRIQATFLKLETTWLTLGFENMAAKASQKKLVQLISENQSLFQPEEYIQEVRLLLLLLMNSGQSHAASRLLTDLVAYEMPRYLDDKVMEVWLVNSLVLAATNNDPGLGKRALRDLQQNESSIPSRWKFYVYHSAAILNLALGDLHAALDWQNRLNKLPKAQRDGKEWVPYLVKGICLYEMGYHSDALKSLQAIGIPEKGSYQELGVSVLKGYFSLDSDQKQTEYLLKNALERLKSVEPDTQFGYDMNFFDLRIWIQSKLENRPLRDLFNAGNEYPGFFRMARVS